MPLYFCPAVDVDKIIMLGSETINMPLIGRGGLLEVLPLPEPINVRLTSTRLRSGTGSRRCWIYRFLIQLNQVGDFL